MNQDDIKKPDAYPTPTLPLRFGIRDGLAAMFLFAAQLKLLTTPMSKHEPIASDVRHVLVSAALSAALTFGAAYLSARFATQRRIENFGIRVLLLVLFDLLLMLSPVIVLVLILLWPLMLMALIAWRMSRSRDRLAQLKQQSDASTELER